MQHAHQRKPLFFAKEFSRLMHGPTGSDVSPSTYFGCSTYRIYCGNNSVQMQGDPRTNQDHPSRPLVLAPHSCLFTLYCNVPVPAMKSLMNKAPLLCCFFSPAAASAMVGRKTDNKETVADGRLTKKGSGLPDRAHRSVGALDATFPR